MVCSPPNPIVNVGRPGALPKQSSTGLMPTFSQDASMGLCDRILNLTKEREMKEGRGDDGLKILETVEATGKAK